MFKLLFVGAVAVGLASFLFLNPSLWTLDTNAVKVGYRVQPVPVEVVTPQTDFAQRLIDAERPVVLKGAIMDEWPARKLWSPDYVAKHLGYLSSVKKHSKPLFQYFDTVAVYDDLPDLKRKVDYSSLEMSAQDFMRALNSKTDGYYYYYSGKLSGSLVADVQPLSKLEAPSSNSSMIHLWMGGANVTASLHYDAYYNFYAQLYGKKRFLLFSPDVADKVYLFPRPHAGFRQSQVNVENPNFQKFPLFSNLQAYEAILEPGDLLYLPPYWLHEVKALTTSISVNVWSDSKYYYILDAINHQALPFEGSWSQQEIQYAVKAYLTAVVEEFHGRGSMGTFVKTLLIEQRYSTLYPQGSSRLAIAEAQAERLCSLKNVDVAAIEARVRQGNNLGGVVSEFKKVPRGGVLDVALANYIEFLAVWAVDPVDAFAFILNCLS